MENVVNLEQLNYRDQLIKEYIDQHSGGGSSMPTRLALTRYDDGNSDSQHLYLGVLEGTDLTGVTLKYMRSSTVKQRNKRKGIRSNNNKWRGLHEIWAIPQKDKIPLITMTFDPEVAFTKGGYEYRELLFTRNGETYDAYDFTNQGFDSGYNYPISNMMRHRCGGVLLVKDGKYITGQLRFHTTWSDNKGDWRISLF